MAMFSSGSAQYGADGPIADRPPDPRKNSLYKVIDGRYFDYDSSRDVIVVSPNNSPDTIKYLINYFTVVIKLSNERAMPRPFFGIVGKSGSICEYNDVVFDYGEARYYFLTPDSPEISLLIAAEEL